MLNLRFLAPVSILGATSAFLFCGESSPAATCVQPATTIRSVDSPMALSAAVIATLATTDGASQETPLSPEWLGVSTETEPLAKAKTCVGSYMGRFLQSQNTFIRETASSVALAMDILAVNESELSKHLVQMAKRNASTAEISAQVLKERDDGLGRWTIFVNVAVDFSFAVAAYDKTAKRSTLKLEPEEAEFLRLELLRHFPIEQLSRPERLEPSPQKAVAIIYRLLKQGSLSETDWK